MNDRAYTGRSVGPTRSSDDDFSITTVAGLKKAIHTAVIQYFAPVAALYNVVATTAGLRTVRWEANKRS
jgi:hypothetical protein